MCSSSPIFWCSQTGDHQQEDLPKLAINQIWKVYKKKRVRILFIFWLPAENDYRNLAINNNNNNNVLKIGKLGPFFHQKNPPYLSKTMFSSSKKKCTNLMRSSAKSFEGQNFLFWMHACMTTTTTSAVVMM
jgi:hypothetical protein